MKQTGKLTLPFALCRHSSLLATSGQSFHFRFTQTFSSSSYYIDAQLLVGKKKRQIIHEVRKSNEKSGERVRRRPCNIDEWDSDNFVRAMKERERERETGKAENRSSLKSLQEVSRSEIYFTLESVSRDSRRLLASFIKLVYDSPLMILHFFLYFSPSLTLDW